MAELSVQLSADVKRLQSELKKAQKALLKTGDVAEDSASKVGRTGTKAATGISKVGKASANATPTLQEFSRVIQDAPFGIQGVGNNITQLVSVFGNLQKSAGGTSSALRLVLRSFIGPAGFLFLISSAVSLLTVFGDKIFKAAGGTSNFAKALKEANDEATSQIAKVGVLSSVLLDLEAPQNARRKAVEDLNKIMPGYLDFIDLERSTYNEIDSALKRVNQQLRNNVKEKALGLAIEKTLGDTSEDLAGAYLRQTKAQAGLRAAVKRTRGENAIFNKVSADLPLGEQVKQIIDLANQYGFNQNRLAGLAIAVNEYNAANQGVNEVLSDQEKATRGLIAAQAQLFKQLNAASGQAFDAGEVVVTPSNDANKKVRGIVKGFASVITESGIAQVGGDITEAIVPSELPSKIAEPLSAARLEFINFSNDLRDLGNASIVPAITGIFQNVGAAISQGGNVFAALGQGLLQAFGGFLSQLGGLLVSYGIAAKQKGILDTAIAVGGPVAIAAGAAAIKQGIILAAIGGAISALAGGGFGGPGGGGGGFTTPDNGFRGSSTTFAGSAGSGGRVVFEIEGRTLVGVLRRELGSRGQLGGISTV